MIPAADIFRFLGFCAPVFSALTAASLILGIYPKQMGINRKLTRILFLYFSMVCFNWTQMLLYVFIPQVYVMTNAFFYVSILLSQVLFYHFIYMLTNTGEDPPFPVIHYIIPLLIFTVFFIWSLYIPFDVKLSLVESRGQFVAGYEAYSRFFTSRIFLLSVYILVYLPFNIYRLYRYRKVISDYSSDEERSSLRWVVWLLALSFAFFPYSLIGNIFSKSFVADTFIAIIPSILLIFQHVILCYNMLTHNYSLIYSATASTDNRITNTDIPRQETINQYLNEEKFEQYMQEHKLYLDPKLRITDLTVIFGTNRTYLSWFINNNYGMNFSNYINNLRLREVDELRHKKDHKHLNEKELVLLAGFSNYRGYKRFLNSLNK